jgi:hypothetical protein
MKKMLAGVVLLASAAVLGGCVMDPYGHARLVGYNRDDATWDVIRRDPCRYDEYRRFAKKHKNPEKRRRFAEALARDGCERERRSSPYGDSPYRRDDY